MFFVYAKRTDTDAFIVVDYYDDDGALASRDYAREVTIEAGVCYSKRRGDDEPYRYFQAAAVFVAAFDVTIIESCDENGGAS